MLDMIQYLHKPPTMRIGNGGSLKQGRFDLSGEQVQNRYQSRLNERWREGIAFVVLVADELQAADQVLLVAVGVDYVAGNPVVVDQNVGKLLKPAFKIQVPAPMRIENLVGEPQKNETGRRGHLERMAIQRRQQKDVVPPVGKVPVVDALKPLPFVDEDKLKKVVLMGPLNPLRCFFDSEF
jgi:hypothetical protein